MQDIASAHEVIHYWINPYRWVESMLVTKIAGMVEYHGG